MTIIARAEVLVVEDEPFIRFDAIATLAAAGFSVLEAEDGASALATFDAHPAVRLLFSDINMPGAIDGLTLARIVQERGRPGMQFILTSGRVTPTAAQLPDEGVYLPKPYCEHEVVALVRKLLP